MKLTVIVLARNEQIHIERCLRSVRPIASRLFVVDSFSTDNTVEIAHSLGAEVVQREWKNYADQFQWAIEQCAPESEWLMRMDADEYLEPEAQEELQKLLAEVPAELDGIYIKRKVLFEGQWIRHGGFYPHILLRLWRVGKGCIEQRWMDEHIVLPPGATTILLKGHLVDENLKGMTFWINKHNSYASREAVDLLNNKYLLFEKDESIKRMDDPQARVKRILKEKIYSRLPAGLRAFIYFIYRYFILFGFLDGKKGFLWHFMQGFWYRLLVDVKIMEIEERSQGDVAQVRRILCEQHGISL
jgi:glycosyltransferase involved in cell wall biosynthesis